MKDSVRFAIISFKSWPPEKAFPAPAMTTTRIDRIGANRVQLGLQRLQHRHRNRVELARPIQRERGHTALDCTQHQRTRVGAGRRGRRIVRWAHR